MIANAWIRRTQVASSLLALGALSVLSSGCAPQGSPADEALGTAQEAVGGEPACATVALTAGNGVSVTYAGVAANVHSPDDHYDNPGCPRQYIVQVNAWNTLLDPEVNNNWGTPLPTNPTECANARYQMNYYGYDGVSWSGVLYTDYRVGGWTGSSCVMTYAAGYPKGNLVSVQSGVNKKIRVAIQNWQWISGGRIDYKLIDASVNTPAG